MSASYPSSFSKTLYFLCCGILLLYSLIDGHLLLFYFLSPNPYCSGIPMQFLETWMRISLLSRRLHFLKMATTTHPIHPLFYDMMLTPWPPPCWELESMSSSLDPGCTFVTFLSTRIEWKWSHVASEARLEKCHASLPWPLALWNQLTCWVRAK